MTVQEVAGWRVAVRDGKVWLHPPEGGDGDLSPVKAWDLAVALQSAALEAGGHTDDGSDADELAVEERLERERFGDWSE